MSIRGRYVWTAISGLALGFAGLSVSSVRADAPATEPTKQQLIDRVNQMQTQMDQMKTQLDAQQVSTADEQASIAKLLADADKRSQLLDTDGTATAGWDPEKKRFFITDGTNFYFHPGVIFQFRYAGDYQDKNGAAPAKTDQFDSGFEVRRAKFYFDGYLFSPDLTYKFQWQDNNNDGTPSLEYAYVTYTFAHNVIGDADLALRGGQFKDPVFKEEAGVGDNFQPLVERSLANYEVGGLSNVTPGGGQAYVQGLDLQLTGAKSALHSDVVFHDGYNGANSDFTNGLDANQGVANSATGISQASNSNLNSPQDNFGAAARVDYKVFGDWADASDLTGMQSGKTDLLVIGGGVDFTEGSAGTVTSALGATSASSGFDVVRYTADAQYQSAHKWTLYGAFYGDYAETRVVGVTPSTPNGRSDLGGVLEGGYDLNNSWQLTARYSLTDIDQRFRGTGPSQFNEIGLGVNYFMGSNGSWANNSKISADVDYLPNGNPSSTGLDYLTTPNDKPAVVFRVQYQMFL